MTSWPTVHFPCLWHIGSMNAGDKGSWSLEGEGLSVSTAPDAWEEIARLGGRSRWTLTKEGNRFLDALALSSSQQEDIVQWGVENERLVRVAGWKVSWYDDELGDEVYFCTTDEEEALDEWGEGREIEKCVVVVAGSSWRDEVGHDNADQVILAQYGVEVLDMDGVWWAEDLNVARLSAPRGVISVEKLPSWIITHAPRRLV